MSLPSEHLPHIRSTPLITDPIRTGPPWLALVTALVKVKVARHG
jgi:hypothetical protein